MSLLDGMRKARGRQLSASGAAPRRRIARRSTSRLPADRIAAALGTLPVAPPAGAPSRSARGIPKRTSGGQVPQVRTRGGAPAGQVPLGSPSVGSSPVGPDSGRHRGSAERLAGGGPPPRSVAGQPRHGRASGNELGEFSRVGTSGARSAPVVSAPVVPVRGRHRRTSSHQQAKSVSLLAGGAKSHRLVVLGVLVLLVAVAVVFGVRVALAPPLAQPQLVATTAQGQPGQGSGAVPAP